MAKINISLRIKPAHHNAIKQEIKRGKTLTGIFEEMLDREFPSSEFFKA
jgi:hypothetical protein